jgi:hypothetical protein
MSNATLSLFSSIKLCDGYLLYSLMNQVHWLRMLCDGYLLYSLMNQVHWLRMLCDGYLLYSLMNQVHWLRMLCDGYLLYSLMNQVHWLRMRVHIQMAESCRVECQGHHHHPDPETEHCNH